MVCGVPLKSLAHDTKSACAVRALRLRAMTQAGCGAWRGSKKNVGWVGVA